MSKEQKGEEENKIEQSGVNSSENTSEKTYWLEQNQNANSDHSKKSSSQSQSDSCYSFIPNQFNRILEKYGRINIKEKDLTGIANKQKDRLISNRFFLNISEDGVLKTYDLEIYTSMPSGKIYLKLYKTTIEEIMKSKTKTYFNKCKDKISETKGNILEVLEKIMRES